MTRLRSLILDAGAVVGSLCLVLALAGALFGVKPLVFRSGSMSPDIPTGALALARTVDASELDVGDVVSVHDAEGSRVTHRVVGTQQQGDRTLLTLQGDANPAPDAAPYPVTTVDRVFWSVPRLGQAVAFLSSPWGLVLLAGLLVATLVIAFRPVHARVRASAQGRHRATSALVAAPVAAAIIVSQGSSGTRAAFTDTAVVTSGGAGAGTLQAPTGVTCSGAGLLARPTISWTAATTGVATGVYRVVSRQGSATGPLTEYLVSGTSWQLPAAFLTVAGTSYITVQTASQAGTSWTSKNYAVPGITVTVTGIIGVSAVSSCATYTVTQPAW